MPKKAIIIGAGPAGLTAAYELLQRTDIVPIILEKSGDIGGISKTVNYKGNRMDMGPHRFFSKSDRVMNWWLDIFPLEQKAGETTTISYQNKSREINATPGAKDTVDNDKVMLVIERLTRIYFLRRFFAYPIQLSIDTLRLLGIGRTVKIIFSYLYSRLSPHKPEKSLEDFLINKFGKQLYLLFFKDYTEKVWGIPCHEISAEWGAQRIKGVSLSKAIQHALQSGWKKRKKGSDSIAQKGTETSLIEQFLYPRLGPGQLWEHVAEEIKSRGGEIYHYQDVKEIDSEDGCITSVKTIHSLTGDERTWEGDYFFSTMPVQELIAGMNGAVPNEVKEVAAGLQYRDFINVGVLLKQFSAPGKKPGSYQTLTLKDSWIYIQEREVKLGRLQIYNNWGGHMVKDPNTTWIGMEYFCNKTDAFWDKSDEEIKQIAIDELEQIALARREDVLDIIVLRMEKTYPAYFGTYNQFDKIKVFLEQFGNLFLVGRNGMHKYNNTDHSMLTAMVAVDNIVEGITSKENLWSINTEQEYHEVKKNEPVAEEAQPAIEKEPVAIPAFEPQEKVAFMDFVWRKNKTNRWYLIVSFVLLLLQFAWFKTYYPKANFMPDSYGYLEVAATNSDVGIWPVGYSKFLRVFSSFAHSDTLLTGFQYLFLELAALYFLFTLFYFFRPGKIIQPILCALVVINPLFLYTSNYVSSDALFNGLSIVWFTLLLWIIYRPKQSYIVWHAVILLILFTIRYNAIYYPLIAITAFGLSRQRLLPKITGIALSIVLVAFSFWYTSNKNLEQSGQRQFSAFGGWQLANNALYMYSHVNNRNSNVAGLAHTPFHSLDSLVQQHLSKSSQIKELSDSAGLSFYFLWSERAPLKQYMHAQWKKDSTAPYYKQWASMGPLYTDYAWYLIKKYPMQFVQYYLLPNALNYYAPPLEFLGVYNMGKDSVDRLAKNWFGYKDASVKRSSKGGKTTMLNQYPIVAAIVNISFLLGCIGFIVFDGRQKLGSRFSKTLLLTFTLWLANFCFSVFAAPIVMRYQLFSMIICIPFVLLLFRFIYKAESILPVTKQPGYDNNQASANAGSLAV